MEYKIEQSSIQNVHELLMEYLTTLNGVTDDFWEEHIVKGDFYKITTDLEVIGYFTVYNGDKITQFYMKQEYLHLAQAVFKQVLIEYGVKTAYVATCDQLFLSLCLDHHSKVELQAYFFDGTKQGKVRPPEYARNCIIRLTTEEFDEVLKETGNFFTDFTMEQIKSEEIYLYQLRDDNEALGYGIIVPNKLQTQYWACGMITLEDKRRKGVGRSIQIHLGDICREHGAIPISGCWYYNHLSKKTIESAGRYSKTRLLNITFK